MHVNTVLALTTYAKVIQMILPLAKTALHWHWRDSVLAVVPKAEKSHHSHHSLHCAPVQLWKEKLEMEATQFPHWEFFPCHTFPRTGIILRLPNFLACWLQILVLVAITTQSVSKLLSCLHWKSMEAYMELNSDASTDDHGDSKNTGVCPGSLCASLLWEGKQNFTASALGHYSVQFVCSPQHGAGIVSLYLKRRPQEQTARVCTR